MCDRILVPLDGSAFGDYALRFAGSIARATRAKVELVHVHACRMPEPYLQGITPYQFEEVYASDLAWEKECIEQETERLETLAASLAGRYGVETGVRLLEGPTAQMLNRHAEGWPADLVVMATHGRSGLERAWLGSVADTLVRRVTMPLLLIRPPAEAPEPPEEPFFRRILVPLDGSTFAEQALGLTARLAGLLGATVTLVQVVGPTPASGEALPPRLDIDVRRGHAEDYLKEVAARFEVPPERSVIVERRPAAAILAAAASAGANLIAMATHGRGGVSRLLLGSTADKVLRGATTPVLLYRPKPAIEQPEPTSTATSGERTPA